MKDQYVGDIGDFGKVLLLKHLASLGFKIGINWVLTENDKSSDGRHRDYVDYCGKNCLCYCDIDLLQGIVPLARTKKPHRKIADLENLIRGFSKNAVFYSKLFDGDTTRSTCDDEAFDTLTAGAANLIFFDPDNGIGGESGSSAKHVYLADLRRYWECGQSLLIYHHLPQRRSAEDAIKNLTDLLQSLPDSKVKSYRFRRGSGRVYMLCIQPEHCGFIPDTEQGEKLAPLLYTKRDWASRCRASQKSCSKSHRWYTAN